MFPLEGPEVECVKKLADAFRTGEPFWSFGGDWSVIGLTEENFRQVLGVLEGAGVIKNASHNFEGQYGSFVITPLIIHYDRHLAAIDAKGKEKKDMIESIKYTAQRHPVIAWGLVTFTVLTALMTLLSQTTTFLKNVGVIK